MPDKVYIWGGGWGAPVCDGAVNVATPPWGEPCGYCEEVIVEGEQGTYQVFQVVQGPMMLPIHKECLLRQVMGGIGHHTDHALWCIERGDPDGGVGRRESARQVWRWVLEGGALH